MRRGLTVAAMLPALAVAPALGAQITQTVSAVQSLGDFTPFSINYSPFNPSLGALTSVIGELTGVVAPIDFSSFPSSSGTFPSATQTVRWFVNTGSFSGSNAFSGSFPGQTVAPETPNGSASFYRGTPFPVDLSFNFGDPSAFVLAPGPMSPLQFGFRAFLSGVAVESDYSTFNGNMRLTYDYAAVPEPGSFSLIGAGVLALLGCGWVMNRHGGGFARRP